MKLHLGCGQIYLDDYKNIDFPLSKHSVQKKSVADEYVDITELKFKKETIDEIRLHHVFEHFPRTQAIALILSWRSWLKKGGILRIEVPDFKKTAKSVLSSFTSKSIKSIGLRHIFGSQEASWAVHFHGWDKDELKTLMEISGYATEKIKTSRWKGTYNIEIIAKKDSKNISKVKSKKIAKEWISRYLVDNSNSEIEMLKIWKTESNKQIEKSWGK